MKSSLLHSCLGWSYAMLPPPALMRDSSPSSCQEDWMKSYSVTIYLISNNYWMRLRLASSQLWMWNYEDWGGSHPCVICLICPEQIKIIYHQILCLDSEQVQLAYSGLPLLPSPIFASSVLFSCLQTTALVDCIKNKAQKKVKGHVCYALSLA